MAIATSHSSDRTENAPRAWFMLFAFLSPAVLIMGMDRAVITVTAPALQEHYGLSLAQLGLLFTVFHWSYAAMQIPCGLIIERFGSRIALLGAVIVWSLMTALTPIAGGFVGLLLTRALLGAGQAADWPASITGINNLFSNERRPRANSILLASLYLGPIVGGPIAGYMTQRLGWQAVFVAVAVVGLVFAAAGWKFYDDGHSTAAHRASAQKLPRLKPREWAAKAGPLVVLYMAMGMLFSLYLLWLPTYLIKGRGMDVGSVGIASGFISGGLCIGVFAAGQLLPILRRRCSTLRMAHVPLGTAAVTVASICGMTFALPGSNVQAVSIAVLAAIALGICQVILWSSVQDIAGPRTALISGTILLCGNLAAGASPLLSAIMFERTGSWELSTGVIGITGLIGTFAFLLIRPDRPINSITAA